jgi:hypothetical protein
MQQLRQEALHLIKLLMVLLVVLFCSSANGVAASSFQELAAEGPVAFLPLMSWISHCSRCDESAASVTKLLLLPVAQALNAGCGASD